MNTVDFTVTLCSFKEKDTQMQRRLFSLIHLITNFIPNEKTDKTTAEQMTHTQRERSFKDICL